ncbi:uncharacterized protein CTHT_0074430 [Thermochaetoides thermophila DSM 1495]|uniref:Malic enzyme NAD-binding domain-containing protein n=1 Tax=Chaetomium thermophilum (strain DSM 1495 / CBS 144.50 / IMI 039719) TaxID=759272 RepID=G0SI43_CHATD|nr:hypothetical protein CTHT_0074430 [Thermochaetoides thermophila DSM 1495]EGS17113.1 hypothetical protein CTHT_0074430 [Thermochaetoides thermophila DSM 1495]
MFRVVYTPTEGDAIQNYSRIFRSLEGVYLNINEIDRIHHDLSLWGTADIDYILVTDGEEILGISDQGYLKEKRVLGARYDQFLDTLVTSASGLYLKACIYFEDLALDTARGVLAGWEDTCSISTARPCDENGLRDTRMAVFGAGTAGVGIADQVVNAIMSKLREQAAVNKIWLVDNPGLLSDKTKDISEAQKVYARSSWNREQSDFLEAVKQDNPNILVGTSTVLRTLTEDIVPAMVGGKEGQSSFRSPT